MALLRQSTTYTRMFLMVDATDHVSGKTGLTVTVTLSKAGGSFAGAGGSITEISSGWYKIALTTTDTNTLGDLTFHCTGTGADPTDFNDQVVAIDVGDTVRFGLTALPNAAAEAAGGLYTRGTGAGQINQPANGQIDANAAKVGGATVASGAIPNVAAGASGGLPTADSTNSVKLQTPLKRNTALANFTFSMFDAATGAFATGLTVAATRSIDGASPASCANSVSAVSSGAGRYKIDLAAADLNGSVICLHFTASGAKDTSHTIFTLP